MELVLSRAYAVREISNCTGCVGMRVKIYVERGRICDDSTRLGFKSDLVAVFVLAYLIFVPADKQSHLALVACKIVTRVP